MRDTAKNRVKHIRRKRRQIPHDNHLQRRDKTKTRICYRPEQGVVLLTDRARESHSVASNPDGSAHPLQSERPNFYGSPLQPLSCP